MEPSEYSVAASPRYRNGNVSKGSLWASVWLLTATFLFAYWEVSTTLVEQWRHNAMYTHGFVVPLISLYLAWITRKSLTHTTAEPNFLFGGTILMVSLGLLLAGNAGGVIVLQEVTLAVTIAGMVLFILGFPFLRKLSLPIAYLFFMIPFWEELITGRLHEPFQHFSAKHGVVLLRFLGIPAHLQGVYIELPGVTLEVARACSGINYLIAVIAIGLPLAHLYVEGWIRKTVFLSIAALLAVFGNVVRITLIGFFAYREWASPLHGPFHLFQGLFVSVFGYLALFSLLPLFSKHRPPGSRVVRKQSYDEPPKLPSSTPKVARQTCAVAVTAILLVTTGLIYRAQSPTPVPPKIDLKDFPFDLGSWTGVPHSSIFSELFKSKGVDHEISRLYRNDRGESVGFYIGYFEQQNRSKKVANYLTDQYHRLSTRLPLKGHTLGFLLDVNQFVAGNHGKEQLGVFWYDLNGRTAAGPWEVRALTIWSALRHGRTNAAFVAVTSDVGTEEDIPEVSARIHMFVNEMYPILGRFLPR